VLTIDSTGQHLPTWPIDRVEDTKRNLVLQSREIT
jgi:hypothetical protein